MSTELGPVTFGHRQGQVFLGRDIARDKNYSEEIAAKIDKEIRKFLSEAYQKTEELLQNNIDKLHLIAQALIEKETLEGSRIEQLMKYGRILDKNEQPPDDNSGTAVIPPDAVTVCGSGSAAAGSTAVSGSARCCKYGRKTRFKLI